MIRYCGAIGASMCLTLALWSSLWGWAALAVNAPRLAMSTWEQGFARVDPKKWRAAYARLQRVRRVMPLNADLSAELGRMHMWQALAFSPSSPASKSHRAFAIAYYREAMHNRPTWALGWTNLAENSILLNGLDSRSEHALRLAAALVPWEPGVQQQVIWLGLSLWDLLSPEVRDTVRDLVGRSVAIDNDIPRTVRLAHQFGWASYLRPMLENPKHRKALAELEGDPNRR